MSNFIDKEEQAKIRKDFFNQFGLGTKSATAIRKELAEKYNRSVSTIHKITTNGYKLEAAKVTDLKLPPIEKIKDTKPTVVAKPKGVKTFIFTSWEVRVGVDQDFIKILESVRDFYNAEVYVTPLWPDDLPYLPPALKRFKLLDADMHLNRNIMFKYVPTHALCNSPTQGWGGAHDKTIILPGLIKDLKTEKADKLCKQIISTGSIGELNAIFRDYNHVSDKNRLSFTKRWSMVQNRRGGRAYEIARNFTLPTALIVDVLDDNTFLTRYITMQSKGVVYDKGYKFTANKKEPEPSSPEAIIFGDMHSWYADLDNFVALSDMCKVMKPKSIVLNDFIDFQSVNYHEFGDFAKVVKFPSIKEEVEEAKTRLNIVAGWASRVYYLGSNHDNFIVKFLADEKSYKKIGNNYETAINLRSWQLATGKHPVEHLLDFKSIKNLQFIEEHGTLKIKNVVVTHGHVGLSGRPTTFRNMQRIYNYYVQGHTHVPEVFRNGVCVGTSTKLKLGYNIGPSGWMHAHALIHPDGSTQLLPVIYGKWTI